MQKIIKKIFNSFGYEDIFYRENLENEKSEDKEITCMFWYPRKESKLSNFHMIIFLKDTDMLKLKNIKKEMIYYFKKAENRLNYAYDIEKNTSLMVCVEVDSLKENFKNNENTRKLIYDVEEDPYMFKKNVLLYTDKQVERFSNKFNKSNTLIKEKLYSIINNNDMFKEFKKNPYKSTSYSLVSSLFIKIPFLRYERETRKLDDIIQKIHNFIKDIGEDKELLVDEIVRKTQEEIKEMDDSEILTMIGVDVNGI
ncbi:ABC-three component system middle component 1 [Sporosalibacterium faouarense]|uniref:ABC-three component system middle component 1 n=1 Tax=Sporosalibacterium faouarense TaxID=516123 RepID=UPI00192B504F|nr:ABC-three component system middle component 1 [Sporosalibacterium faouarense]